MSKIPLDDPPPYSDATAPSSSSLQVPTRLRSQSRNGIPRAYRRSMEDEHRELPTGWTRQFDAQSSHHFYVDTQASPPRSIWHHPHDDETFLESQSPKERERIAGLHKAPNTADIEAESTDEEDEAYGKPGQHHGNDLPQHQQKETFGQKMKDKVTGSTHAEREKKRQQRAEEEQRAYAVHQKIRQAMKVAMQTGEPQLIGKDKEGHDLYVEPSQGGYGHSGGGYGHSGYGNSGAGHGGRSNNQHTSGVYANPNARFIRPEVPYQRPYGYGYGGGYGMPLMMGGGLMGGMMMGGMMGGGLGGFGGGGF